MKRTIDDLPLVRVATAETRPNRGPIIGVQPSALVDRPGGKIGIRLPMKNDSRMTPEDIREILRLD